MAETYYKIAEMDKFRLNEYLIKEYSYQIPAQIEYAHELKEAGDLLIRITNANSFLTNILSTVSLFKRTYKRRYEACKKGSEEYYEKKREFEDYVDKELILSAKIEALDGIKQTISRMITIKQEINKELNMAG